MATPSRFATSAGSVNGSSQAKCRQMYAAGSGRPSVSGPEVTTTAPGDGDSPTLAALYRIEEHLRDLAQRLTVIEKAVLKGD